MIISPWISHYIIYIRPSVRPFGLFCVSIRITFPVRISYGNISKILLLNMSNVRWVFMFIHMWSFIPFIIIDVPCTRNRAWVNHGSSVPFQIASIPYSITRIPYAYNKSICKTVHWLKWPCETFIFEQGDILTTLTTFYYEIVFKCIQTIILSLKIHISHFTHNFPSLFEPGKLRRWENFGNIRF